MVDLQSKVKQVRLVEKLGKQGFDYDTKEVFEPITKADTDSNQNLLEEANSTKKAIAALDESNIHAKVLELMSKNGVVHPSLMRAIAKPLVSSNKSQFWLYDVPDSNNWNHFEMKGEKLTIYDNKVIFENSGKIFTLRGDVLKMVADYNFDTTNSPDAKLINDLMVEMHVAKHSRGKSLRDRNLKKILLKEVY